MSKDRIDAYSVGASARRSGTVKLGGSQEEREVVPSETTVHMCPVCHQENQPSEIYCFECGFLLSSVIEDSENRQQLKSIKQLPRLEDTMGRNFPLRPGINTLGRENADILLKDRSISRLHSAIVYDEERCIFSVEDTGSTNGSTLNGEPLPSYKPRPLIPGDKLTFGNIVLRFVAGGEGQIKDESLPVDEEQIEAVDEITDKSASAVTESKPAAGRLVLLRGIGDRQFLLYQGASTIGRHKDNTICLTGDRYVSGHHAKIEVDGALFLLSDLGSTNGTYLNGLRLTTNTAIAMSDGDEALIGGNLFQFYKSENIVSLDSDSVDGEKVLSYEGATIIGIGAEQDSLA